MRLCARPGNWIIIILLRARSSASRRQAAAGPLSRDPGPRDYSDGNPDGGRADWEVARVLSGSDE